MQKVSRELVAASSKPLVLSILANGESYGYEIIQEVKRLSEGVLEWTDGMLYPVLHRLERDQLIESFWQVADTGRKRKYYRLTRQGIKEIAVQKSQWRAVDQTLINAWGGGTKPCST